MGLTERETKVLKLRKAGLSQAEVARRLDVTQAAVSKFELSALRKLQDAGAMLAWARQIDVDIPEQPTYKQEVR